MATSCEGGSSPPSIEKSTALFERARRIIPCQTQTFAKGPSQVVLGAAPLYLDRGKGCRVVDVDGNGYIDMTMGVGPLVLGYADDRVDAAIRDQLASGITFSLVHPLEVAVAERVADLVPHTEAVRFSKTGADVTSAAIRLARAFTRRDRIVCCGYHGWHDWYIGTTLRPAGVPEAVRALTRTCPYNDLAAFEAAIGSDTAAVILEPTIFDPPAPGFLEGLRAACDAMGALLIFDEMWTGFRLAVGGAQERFGVRADLCCFSKAVANGMPLAVLTGRADVMALLEEDVFFFTTFGGEALSLAAAAATLEILVAERVPEALERRGVRLIDGYNAIARELGLSYTRCRGYGCRSIVDVDAAGGVDALTLKSLFQQELIDRGVLWHGFNNLSQAFGDDEMAVVLDAYRGALTALKSAVDAGEVARRLRGRPMQPLFRPVR